MGLSLAALVFFAAPSRRTNQFLGMLLVIEVAIVGGYRLAEYAAPGVDRGLLGMKNFGLSIGWQAYLLFAAAALDTPLLRPFQTRLGRGLLWASMVFFVALFFALPQLYSTYSRDAAGRFVATAGSLDLGLNFLAAVVFIYVLIASISAYRRARVGTIARQRARAFVIAFGLRDAVLAPTLFLLSNPITRRDYTEFEASVPGDPIVWVALLYYPLVAYGILKWQLFDIDLRLKWTLRRGTVPALVLAAFFIASEGAQAILADRFQSTLVGILGAALLVFFFFPLQRFADRIAHEALPNVNNTSEYLTYRRFELYRAALEGAGRDGEITSAERAMLDRLRAKLEISDQDAREVEHHAAKATA